MGKPGNVETAAGEISGQSADLYGDAYYEGPMAAWHRLSRPAFEAFLRRSVQGAQLPGPALDLGCGDGVYGALLAELAGAVDGWDGAAPALAKAEARGVYRRLAEVDLATSEGAGGAGAGGAGTEGAWPADPGTYGLVFTTEVIEHLPDEARFSSEIARLLAPGGRLVLTTTTYHLYLFYYLCFAERVEAARLRDFFAGALGKARPADRFVRTLWNLTGGHEHGFRARRLLRAVRDAGLVVDAWKYVNVQPVFPLDGLEQPRFRGSSARRMARLLLRPFGRGVNALCRATGFYGPNILISAHKPPGAQP